MNHFSFILSFGLFSIVLSSLLGRHYLRARRAENASWETLLHRLTAVDRDKLTAIAVDAIGDNGGADPRAGAYALQPTEIWSYLGGMEGLEALEKNCEVLIDLAAYLQRWYPEAVVIAEQLRLNAREIEWHVGRLKGAAQTGNLQASFADYAQRAVVTYYLMTKHVLALYEHASVPNLVQLQQAL